MASSEQDKRLRAELAQGLGYFPASLAPEDVARYREQIAERNPERKPVSAMGGVRAANGITSRRRNAAPTPKPVAEPT